jgi:hypothetical protein
MEWLDAKPKSPEQPMRMTQFQPPQQCGQGPYRITVDTLSSPFSESVDVVICAPKAFKGTVSYRPPGSKSEERGFGRDQDTHHEKCRVDATVVTPTGTPDTQNTAGKAGPRGKGAPGAKPSEKTVSVELHGVVVDTGTQCPSNMSRIWVMNHGYTIGDEPRTVHAPLEPGPYVIEIWSALPNDLAGASILVKQRGVPADYKLEDWIAYSRAWNDWYRRGDEMLAASRAQGHQWKTVEEPAATRPPPPARAETPPPKPSPNAAWIPGYWQFTDGWVWSAGFWRVPQQDIEQEKTVEAPTPPPAPRTEAPPDVAYHTARKAVWTPGHWMWNGAGYVWIAGAWRIPEAVEMRWVAPTWRPTRRGTSIYIPGGFVRVGRRR